MTKSRWLRVLALLLGLSLIAAACGDDDDTATPDGDTTDTTAGDGDGQEGGELVLGAEQWPECLNPITQCANASWMHWSVDAHVLPRLMELDPEGNFVPSPVLAGEPELSGEGIDEGSEEPFTVTYTIAEDAAWDDGTPITSSDIAFTKEAYLNTAGAITTRGYEIMEVDDSDPKVAVLTFEQPYADWADLFGGNSEYVLKADAFEGNDLADEMLNDIPFSGGPFVLEEFSQTEALLVRNEAYWDDERMPIVDQVRMVPLEDTDTQINSLLAGEVMGIYPQPSPGINESLEDPNIQLTFGAGTQYEGLWPNHQTLIDGANGVLGDPVVREAVFRSVNRQRILEEILHPINPDTEMLNCGGWVPTVGEWCDQTDFADIEYDPEAAAALLEGDGWVKGDDGIYVKDGTRLSFTWQTVAGNARREAIQALVIPELQANGIEAIADNSDPADLFQIRAPQRQTEMMLFAQVASPDPTVTAIFHCDNIPTPENDFSGQNFNAWCNEQASELMTESDRTPDTAERLDLIHQIGDLVREDFVWLPFYQLPLLTAVNTDLVTGPVDLYTSSPYSAFSNIYDWQLVG